MVEKTTEEEVSDEEEQEEKLKRRKKEEDGEEEEDASRRRGWEGRSRGLGFSHETMMAAWASLKSPLGSVRQG